MIALRLLIIFLVHIISRSLSCHSPIGKSYSVIASSLVPLRQVTSDDEKMRTLYKRELPTETCIAFASTKGKKIFSSAMANGGLKSFFALIQQYHTQSEPAYCGLGTLVLVLNALSIDPEIVWKGPWRWYEEKMLNCCIDLEEIKKTGITLKDFRCLAHCQGLGVELHYCDEENTSLEVFRTAVQKACVSTDDDSNIHGDYDDNDNDEEKQEQPLHECLVVSYSRSVLKQTGSGHFAVLAAYDPVSDSALVLDTARFKYGAHWVAVSKLYEAIDTIDPTTGRTRGYALLSRPNARNDEFDISSLSATGLYSTSILFRSRMTQNPARREYKSFLNQKKSGNRNWTEICEYWSDEKGQSIWNIVEPLRAPRDEEKTEKVMNLRSFIGDLLLSHGSTSGYCCRDKGKCVTDNEAKFVVFLASQDLENRRAIIMDQPSGASMSTRDDLLNEANLIAAAISFSYESSA